MTSPCRATPFRPASPSCCQWSTARLKPAPSAMQLCLVLARVDNGVLVAGSVPRSLPDSLAGRAGRNCAIGPVSKGVTWPMTTDGAITMGDDTNGDPILPIGRAKAHHRLGWRPYPRTADCQVGNGDESQDQTTGCHSRRARPCSCQARAHNVSWHAMGNRDMQALSHRPYLPTPAGERGNN